MLDFMYKTDEMKKALGDSFCGPNILPHGQEVRIAIFAEDSENDGNGVELYCCAMPAKFYTVKALDGKNSLGKDIKGFSLNTGSSELDWAVTTAKMINEGMLGCSA
jgi:hypothetical protein